MEWSPSPTTMSAEFAKIVAMLVLGFGSFSLGIAPMRLMKYFRSESPDDDRASDGSVFAIATTRSSATVSHLLCFGGGVLLFTNLVHLQPKVRKQIESLQEAGAMFNSVPNFGEILFCFGFLSIFFVDELLYYLLDRWVARQADKNAVVVVLARSLSLRRHNPSLTRSSVPPMTGCVPLVTIVEVPEEYDDYQPSSSGNPRGNTAGDVPTESNVGEPAANDGHRPAFGYLFTVIALSVHEVFQGIAIGLENNAGSVWCLLVGVATHKLVIAFSIGLDMTWSEARKLIIVLYLATFAAVTPVGIAAGMLLTRTDGSPGPGVVSIQAYADGILLYVVFFEIFARHKQSGFPYYVLVTALGFGVMLLLQITSKYTTCS